MTDLPKPGTKVWRLPIIFSSLLVAMVFALAACGGVRTDENNFPSGTTPDVVSGGADGVEDGTEGGLDLDNGNVPGSESDDDADEYDELPGN